MEADPLPRRLRRPGHRHALSLASNAAINDGTTPPRPQPAPAPRRAHPADAKNFVLRGDPPSTAPTLEKVEWANGKTLTRPLIGAKKTYQSFTLNRSDGPRLTATGPAYRGQAVDA